MKIKSLLAAVSMVAITAGTASALSIPVTPAMGAAPANAISPEGAVLANELALPADGIGNVTFSVQTDSGNYPAGNNFIVDITLPNGVGIDGPVTGSVLVGPAGGSAVVQNQTGSTIQLFVSIPQDAPVNALDFSLPLSLTSCAVSGNLSVVVETESGTPVEDGMASAPSPIAPCESAFDTDFDPDAADTVIGLTDYEQLRDTAGGPLVLTSTIGLYDALIDPTVGIDLAGTALTPASVDEVAFDICFEDGSEIAGVTVNGVAGTASTDGDTYSFALPFTADLTDAVIAVTVEGDDPITSQNVTVKNVLHDFTDAGGPDLIGSEAGTGGALDGLQREGQSFGVFDWNSGPVGAQTLSVYRITGLEPGVPTTYTATLYNSLANNGAPYTLPSSTVTGDVSGEAVLVSTTLPGIPASIVRYDLGLNFETGRPLDVDRLLSAGGVISDFGGGANSNDTTLQGSPINDADNGH
jgi:hypothetical protein